jgi:two-component system sensor histidine kinase KdpD
VSLPFLIQRQRQGPHIGVAARERHNLGVQPRELSARIAGRLGARWFAVHVETPAEAPGHIRPADREALQRNIALAESVRATVVRVKADRPGDGLIAFANREGITHVIFGQSARTRWEVLLKGSTLNRFLEEVRDAAVQVVPLTEAHG